MADKESLVGRYAKDEHGSIHVLSETTADWVGTKLFLCDAPELDPIMLKINQEVLVSTQDIREAAAKIGVEISPLLSEGKARQYYNDCKYEWLKQQQLAKQEASKKPAPEKVAATT